MQELIKEDPFFAVGSTYGFNNDQIIIRRDGNQCHIWFSSIEKCLFLNTGQLKELRDNCQLMLDNFEEQ